ncbi:hypothetical protein DFP73DRAFT_588773 [Morchella snyderi]|nr:hypothetical protein DFP73DRAFT_588773 [Morchella snyderi]
MTSHSDTRPSSPPRSTTAMPSITSRAAGTLNNQSSANQEGECSAQEYRSVLLDLFAEAEALTAELVEPVAMNDPKWDDDVPGMRIVGIKAGRARLRMEVNKVRKEVEAARARTEWVRAEQERLDKETYMLCKALRRVQGEPNKIRAEAGKVCKGCGAAMVETESTSAGEGVGYDVNRMEKDLVIRELERVRDERVTMESMDFRLAGETLRLRLEIDRVNFVMRWEKFLTD